MIPVCLFREQPEISGKWQQRIRYMLVDEYQDTNLAQYELVRILVAEKQASLWWVMTINLFMPGAVRDRKI